MTLQLVKVSGNSYIVVGDPKTPSIGVIVNQNSPKTAVLIDSGLDESVAKAVDKLLCFDGYRIVAIINTHHHADHCGGNYAFQKKYPDIKIFATEWEKIFIENPSLEPHYLSSGAMPFSLVGENKFFQAMPSKITNVIPSGADGFPIEISGIKLTTFSLSGHTTGMIGVMTDDKVFYCSDMVFSTQLLDTHSILFHTDINQVEKSFDKVLSLKTVYQHVVLYHGGIIRDIDEIIKQNRGKITRLKEFILNKVGQVESIDDLVRLSAHHFKCGEISIPQYFLNRTVVLAYLSSLEAENKIQLFMKNCVAIPAKL